MARPRSTEPILHGSEKGYNTERVTGTICNRCRAAHRVWSSQYTKTAKAKGIRYRSNQVIDHLDVGPWGSRAKASNYSSISSSNRASMPRSVTLDMTDYESDTSANETPKPSLADRLSSAIGSLRSQPSGDYVDEEAPEYLSAVEPDPEPAQDTGEEWSEVADEDIVINKAGMKLIEDNLGFYLSTVGMTLEIIDPYCGPILAQNMPNMVERWSKVIARYPKAAKFFLSQDSGTFLTWAAALQATWPVLYAVYEHHLARTVQVDKQRRIFRVGQQAPQEKPDATMPPMPSYEYTVS